MQVSAANEMSLCYAEHSFYLGCLQKTLLPRARESRSISQELDRIVSMCL